MADLDDEISMEELAQAMDDQENTDIKEVIVWTCICSFITLLILGIAVGAYLRNLWNTPKRKRKRRKKALLELKKKEERRLDNVKLLPISSLAFPSVYQRKLKKMEFPIEFKAVCRKQSELLISGLATDPINAKKNNSARVLPYDANMVRIKAKPGEPTTDYINASWIDGHNCPKKYIAAQGPNIRTLGDFWRMIWQHDVHCIVMATNLFEHARLQCEKYWAANSVTFDDIQVEIADEQFTAEYTLRVFRVTRLNEVREVHQIQFQNWSESDTPHPSTLLEIRRQMVLKLENFPPPVLVHCSNGAGRTGVFIAVDILLDKHSNETELDVAQVIMNLRNSRIHMIAQTDHYRYIYEVVANHITCGVTVVPASQFLLKVEEKANRREPMNITGFEEEFKHVNSLVPELSVGECAGGHRTENRWKSRNIMIQPPERARPYLLSHDTADSSDFVNAVFVDGFKKTNQYIVTQWPLKNTVNDLWRLMGDHNISVVLLLNNFDCKNKNFPRFWPVVKKQCTGFGQIGVELEDEFSCSHNVYCRIFTMQRLRYDCPLNIAKQLNERGIRVVFHHKKNTQRSRIVMLQLMCWPNTNKIPDSTTGLLELIYLAKLWHAKISEKSPLLVICKDGVCRAGVYCAISLCIDRLKATGEIDVFRAVETVKRNRPQLVENIEELQIIYDACLEFLNLLNAADPLKRQPSSTA